MDWRASEGRFLRPLLGALGSRLAIPSLAEVHEERHQACLARCHEAVGELRFVKDRCVLLWKHHQHAV